MPEISDSDLAIYQRSLALLQRLNEKPDARRALQSLVKQHVNKDVVTDEDVAAPFVEQIRNEIKPLVEFKADLEKREKDWQSGEQLRTLKDRGFTPEGIDKIKAFSSEHSIPNLVDAADLYEARKPPEPVAPKSITPPAWNFSSAESDDDKLLLSNEDVWADKMAGKILGEAAANRNRE